MPKADIGLVGLAVMGENLILNMESKGFTVACFNRTVSKVDDFMAGRAKGKNIVGCRSVEELVQSLERPLRQREDAAFLALQLDCIAGEIGDLLKAQWNDFAARFFKAFDNFCAPRCVSDHIQTDHDKIRGDAHQHIGMIDRRTAIVLGFKHHGLIIEMRAKPLEDNRISTV